MGKDTNPTIAAREVVAQAGWPPVEERSLETAHAVTVRLRAIASGVFADEPRL